VSGRPHEPRPAEAAILVVDDTPANLQLLADLLASAGYEVRPTGKPEVALAAALDSPPDLALLDVRMPGMDGFELCRRLKDDPRTAAVPVIFISAAHDESVTLQGFGVGGVDFVNTPIEERTVLARVATHLRLARTQRDLEAERALLEERVRERTARLQESEYVARSMFEQAAVGMAYLALDGRFLRVNRRFCEIVGYPEAELLERGFHDITHPDDRDVDVGISQRLLAGALETDAREKRYVAKDGRLVWVERTVSLVRTTDGRPRWFVSVVHDISARKCAEAAILDYQRRLRELAAQLSRAEERERRNIAADLHDNVGQSLSAMRALLAVARKETAGSPVDGRLEEVSDCLREAIRATREIMSDLSPPALNELGLSAAISGWLRDEVGARHGLDTRFSDDGEPMALDADARAALFRSVRELLANVVRHARASRVSVSLRRNGPMVEIVVEDDGVGMPDGGRPRGAPGESGFGLFSVEERVSDLGGTLTITRAPGGGVRALLTAPLELE